MKNTGILKAVLVGATLLVGSSGCLGQTDESGSVDLESVGGDEIEPAHAGHGGGILDPYDPAHNLVCKKMCITIRRGEFGYVEDAGIVSLKPNVKHGTFALATVGHNAGLPSHMLLWFDLSFIPAGATISSATVGLVGTNTGNSIVRVHRVAATPWSELNVTWNSFNAQYSPIVEAAFLNGGPSHQGLLSYDATALVQQWVDGTFNNNGFLIEQDLVYRTNFWGSEHVDLADRPRMHVCYSTIPEPT